MKLPFEAWLETLSPPEEAAVAYREALVCYRAGAYRAALLFSYLGWGLTIRSRILLAKAPNRIPPKRWSDIVRSMREDDRWDSQVFDCTQMQSPAPVFDVTEDLRAQVRYWRDRRNDCAHFKQNDIVSAHVESFWSFIRSSLGRFVPSGSEEDLLDRLERHFDPNYTPPETSVAPLVAMIPAAVEPTRLDTFLSTLKQRCSRTVGTYVRIRTDALTQFFDAALDTRDTNLQRAVTRYLVGEPDLFIALLRHRPARCQFWAHEPATIRSIWRKALFDAGHQDLPVYAALVRNDLIPSTERDEANLWASKHLQADIPTDSDRSVLETCGFMRTLRTVCFDEARVNDFAWGNRNADVVRWLLETSDLTQDVVARICQVFSSQPFPNKVRDALRELFASNVPKRQEFEQIATAAGRTLPATIFS